MASGGIGDRGAKSTRAGKAEFLRPSELPSLQLQRTPIADLQAEVGKARIVEAAHNYLSELGVLNPEVADGFEFSLSFGLEW